MTDRLDQIGVLLREELAERDDLEPTDVITQWVVIVGLHGADDEGDAPSSAVVRSDPAMAIRHELGLIEERRMFVQAVITDAWRRDRGDDG